MHFVPAAKDTMLNSLTIDRLSLHSDIPSDAGSNELSGGTPAYARVVCSINASSGGSRAMETIDPDPEFDVPPAGVAAFVGFWNSIGPVFHGWAPAKGADKRGVGTAKNIGDVITSHAHGLVNAERLIFRGSLGESPPAGLDQTTIYWGVGVTTDTFQVSLTQGGAAVAITADGEVTWIRCLIETFVGQGKFKVETATLDLNGI